MSAGDAGGRGDRTTGRSPLAGADEQLVGGAGQAASNRAPARTRRSPRDRGRPEPGPGLDAAAPASEHAPAATREVTACGWIELDARLRAVARRRAELQAEEIELILVARRTELHLRFGLPSLREYLERTLGYSPRVAADRMRVASELGALPRLRQALASGELSLSTVREVSRVAVAATEDVWLDAARGRTVREVEALVAGRVRGDLPTTPRQVAGPSTAATPGAAAVAAGVTQVVRFDVTSATHELLRRTRQALEGQLGRPLSDDELLGTLCRAVLGGDGDPGGGRGPTNGAGAVAVPPPEPRGAESSARRRRRGATREGELEDPAEEVSTTETLGRDAHRALVRLGGSRPQVRRAVPDVLSHVGPEATLDEVIRRALRVLWPVEVVRPARDPPTNGGATRAPPTPAPARGSRHTGGSSSARGSQRRSRRHLRDTATR